MDKKPDYIDNDWSKLIEDRIAKWEKMWDELNAEDNVSVLDIWNGRNPIVGNRFSFKSKIAFFKAKEAGKGTIIICAGGAFIFKSSNEAAPVAKYFNKLGFNSVVLDYFTDKEKGMNDSLETRKIALEDAKRAIRYLKYNWSELEINPDKIAIGGFSAGGILSGLAGTLFDYGDENHECPLQKLSSRPDAVLMLYGTLINTLGHNSGLNYNWAENNQLSRFCPEKNIREDSPPFFLFETHADDPIGIIEYGRALASKSVPFVIHTFVNGPHGGGLFNGEIEDSPCFPHTAKWAELACDWLIDYGF